MRKNETLDTYEAPARGVIIRLECLTYRFDVNTFVNGTITENKQFKLHQEAEARHYYDTKVSEDCDNDLTAEEWAQLRG